MSGIRALVCGGRDYDDRAALFAEMDTHHKRRQIGLVICGGARGADSLARAWAELRQLPVAVFPANWSAQGRAAGPIRNAAMLDWMAPDVVIAFPGGAGTADMIERAKGRGVEVIR